MRVSSVHDLQTLVRRRRQQLHLSQEALAARVGVSRRWVYTFETGTPNAAELSLVLRLLASLDIELDARAPEEEVLPAGAGVTTTVDLSTHLARVSRDAGVRGRDPRSATQPGERTGR